MNIPRKEATKSFRKEIILLVLGAAISAIVSFCIDYGKDERYIQRKNVDKMFELNDQISKDIGKRLFLTRELYKNKRDGVNTDLSLSRYEKSKEEWNIKFMSYAALIKHYYGENIVDLYFINCIYNPMVDVGQKVEKLDVKLAHPDYIAICDSLQYSGIIFIDSLFTVASSNTKQHFFSN